MIHTNVKQRSLINTYIVNVGMSHQQKITEAVAQLKKVDLQEIFREILILNSLYSLTNSSVSGIDYMSQAHLSTLKGEMLSNSDYTKYVLNSTYKECDHATNNFKVACDPQFKVGSTPQSKSNCWDYYTNSSYEPFDNCQYEVSGTRNVYQFILQMGKQYY